MQVPWPVALGAVFWSGVVFLLLSLFNIRAYIVRAIPRPLRYAIGRSEIWQPVGLWFAELGKRLIS